MGRRLYKVVNLEGEHVWVLRMPKWFGWLRDRYNLIRYGFIP